MSSGGRLAAMGALLVLGGVAFLWPRGEPDRQEDRTIRRNDPPGEIGRPFTPIHPEPPPPPPTQVSTVPTLGAQRGGQFGQAPTLGRPGEDPEAKARASRIMAFTEQSTSAATADRGRGSGGDEDQDGMGGNDQLGARLQATRTPPVRARRLPNRDLTLTMGTIIPCTPQQPINTQLPGFVSCIVPVDVRCTSGNVVCLDRMTKIVGQIRSAMQHGQNRAFILWTRAETPDGVTVELASPGTDALGQNGLDVEVHTNFLARFGGAVLLSFIDTGLNMAALAASQAIAGDRGGSGNVSFFQMQSGGRNAAATALDASVNIPPYGFRAQGQPAAVFVARDISFADVYRLRAR
jgi:type IV secretion system protein VirB10